MQKTNLRQIRCGQKITDITDTTDHTLLCVHASEDKVQSDVSDKSVDIFRVSEYTIKNFLYIYYKHTIVEECSQILIDLSDTSDRTCLRKWCTQSKVWSVVSVMSVIF